VRGAHKKLGAKGGRKSCEKRGSTRKPWSGQKEIKSVKKGGPAKEKD